MSGERDLSTILSTLDVIRRPGTYVYVSLAHGAVPGAAATIEESEATTSIVEQETAERMGLEWTFLSAWLTIDVHTALDSVGLTAAVATALADAGIACNVLAGRYHDHLLVPLDRADDAIGVLRALRVT